MKRSTILLIIVYVFLWNSGFIGAEYGLPYAKTFTLLFWRYWALTLLLLLYLLGRGRFQWPGLTRVTPTAVIGILAHGVWLSCVLLSLEYGVPAGIVALVVALQPMATGVFSGVAVGEPTPLHRWIGLIIGFIGVVVPILARVDFTSTTSIFGYAVPFGSVVAMTIAVLFQRRLEVRDYSFRLPMDVTLFYQSLATALVLTIPAFALEHLTTQWHPVFIEAMVWLILGVSLGAYTLMWVLVARLDATRVSSLFYLGPPVTMLMGWVAFGDTVQSLDVIGLIIVAAGVLLTQLEAGKDSERVGPVQGSR